MRTTSSSFLALALFPLALPPLHPWRATAPAPAAPAARDGGSPRPTPLPTDAVRRDRAA